MTGKQLSIVEYTMLDKMSNIMSRLRPACYNYNYKYKGKPFGESNAKR